MSRALHSFIWLWLATNLAGAAPSSRASPASQWWKGNLHAHTLWSDGDDYPEMVAEWYKTNGYHFLAFTEHNQMQEGSKWINISKSRGGQQAFERYAKRFGWYHVDHRSLSGTQQVRLKTLRELRRLFEQRNRFLLIAAEEITDKFETRPVHLNAINLRNELKPQGGSNVLDVMQRNVDAVLEQRRVTRQPMFPHINHPNFNYAITAEDLMQVRGEKFFEVYNGHPSVNQLGDEHHPGLERMWDIILAFRLGVLHLGPIYGLAVDDSHHYFSWSPTNSNSGRGWVMVQAARLEAGALIQALEAGDFYASSGVRLKAVSMGTNELHFEIDAEPGVTYTTEFIGTRRGFDQTSEPGTRPPGTIFPTTRRYSREIGAVLGSTEGLTPSYRLRGDELYVRAKVTSSKLKANAVDAGEAEAAWIQPLVPR